MERIVCIITILFLVFSFIVSENSHAQGIDQSENIICHECGKVNSSVGLFCAGCGAKLAKPAPLPSSPFAPKETPDETSPESILDSTALQELISNMSREDLIRWIELLSDRPYYNPKQLDPNLVGNMTRGELEEIFQIMLNRHVKVNELNGFQQFLQVVGFITSMVIVITLFA